MVRYQNRSNSSNTMASENEGNDVNLTSEKVLTGSKWVNRAKKRPVPITQSPERTSSISFKPPTTMAKKKKEPEPVETTGISAALSYITQSAPVEYMKSFVVSKPQSYQHEHRQKALMLQITDGTEEDEEGELPLKPTYRDSVEDLQLENILPRNLRTENLEEKLEKLKRKRVDYENRIKDNRLIPPSNVDHPPVMLARTTLHSYKISKGSGFSGEAPTVLETKQEEEAKVRGRKGGSVFDIPLQPTLTSLGFNRTAKPPPAIPAPKSRDKFLPRRGFTPKLMGNEHGRFPNYSQKRSQSTPDKPSFPTEYCDNYSNNALTSEDGEPPKIYQTIGRSQPLLSPILQASEVRTGQTVPTKVPSPVVRNFYAIVEDPIQAPEKPENKSRPKPPMYSPPGSKNKKKPLEEPAAGKPTKHDPMMVENDTKKNNNPLTKHKVKQYKEQYQKEKNSFLTGPDPPIVIHNTKIPENPSKPVMKEIQVPTYNSSYSGSYSSSYSGSTRNMSFRDIFVQPTEHGEFC